VYPTGINIIFKLYFVIEINTYEYLKVQEKLSINLKDTYYLRRVSSMNNVWLMKTYKEWADRFLDCEKPFIAIDEDGVDGDYGSLTNNQRQRLFNHLKQENGNRRWGHIKRFFDQFYIEINKGDLLILGTGQTTKFYVTAILKIASDVNYIASDESWDSRHRRDVEILWRGEPFLVEEWGWANRLEKMNSEERLKQFIRVYINLMTKKPVEVFEQT
jgi:hypothetical protein